MGCWGPEEEERKLIERGKKNIVSAKSYYTIVYGLSTFFQWQFQPNKSGPRDLEEQEEDKEIWSNFEVGGGGGGQAEDEEDEEEEVEEKVSSRSITTDLGGRFITTDSVSVAATRRGLEQRSIAQHRRGRAQRCSGPAALYPDFQDCTKLRAPVACRRWAKQVRGLPGRVRKHTPPSGVSADVVPWMARQRRSFQEYLEQYSLMRV